MIQYIVPLSKLPARIYQTLPKHIYPVLIQCTWLHLDVKKSKKLRPGKIIQNVTFQIYQQLLQIPTPNRQIRSRKDWSRPLLRKRSQRDSIVASLAARRHTSLQHVLEDTPQRLILASAPPTRKKWTHSRRGRKLERYMLKPSINSISKIHRPILKQIATSCKKLKILLFNQNKID